jgi:hypothetical protein
MPSSYFSPPADHLDPALFDLDTVKDEVRTPLITAAVDSLSAQGLTGVPDWLHMWLTGSAISYQWNADRGNGDLDVQLGIDYGQFLAYNPQFMGIDPYMMSDRINRYLRENLWPKMATATFGGRMFEVTFFWNSLVGVDIDYIKPYAAYDLIDNDWIVRPPELPSDPKSLYPAQWYDATEPDLIVAQRLSQGHTALSQTARYDAGSPADVNTRAQLKLIESQARALYDDIHLNRANAFSMGGHGYSDYNNFRWQRAKDMGTIDLIKPIAGHVQEDNGQEALETAMTWSMGTRYVR